MEHKMVSIILLKNWQGRFAGARLEVSDKKAKKMVDDKVARYVTAIDPPEEKPEPTKGLTTEQAFSKAKK